MTRLVLRVVGWAAWQLVVFGLAFLAWVNLFSEYGIYPDPVVGSATAGVFLGLALFLGTWLPVRRWRSDRR